ETIEATRTHAAGDRTGRASLVFCFPMREDYRLTRAGAQRFVNYLRRGDPTLDPLLLDGAGCLGAGMKRSNTDGQILSALGDFLREHYPQSQWEPDVWPPFVVRDPAETGAKLASVAGEKYSYRELDEFTDIMEKALLATGRKDTGAPLVAKVERS